MRADFAKVLCECYREGRAWADTSKVVRSRLKRRPDDCAVPRNKIRDGRKHFGENLAPLKRYLEAQRGRPWDKVYSEISSACKPQGAVGLHIYQHLFDFIHVRVERDGNAIYGTRWGWRTHYKLQAGDLFVDPNDGIIKVVRGRKKRHQRPTSLRLHAHHKIDGHSSFESLNGVWYIVQWLSLPTNTTKVYNCIEKREEAVVSFRHYQSFPQLYPAHKQQLNKHAIRKHGLRDR